MLDAALYGIILKWGLETVSSVVKDKDPNNIQILIEAIKLRNGIILKRFEYSWEAANDVLDLVSEVEQELAKITSPASKPNGMTKELLIATLHEGLHPSFVRRLKKLRGKFEATNDLFSAYSLIFFGLLNFDNFKRLVEKSGSKSTSDVARLYRHLWETYSTVMLTLIRISSSDIRFWATDVNYLETALKYAEIDRNMVEKMLEKKNQDNWVLSIEKKIHVQEFWRFYEEQNSSEDQRAVGPVKSEPPVQ